MIKIGFIVEGATDVTLITKLVTRLHPDIFMRAIYVGGKSRFYSAHIGTVAFLRKEYQHVFVLFDTDTTDSFNIEDQLRSFSQPFREYGLEKRATLIPIIPEIEAWILSHFIKEIHPSTSPKAALRKILTDSPELPQDITKLVEHVDLSQMKANNQNFAEFVDELENRVAMIRFQHRQQPLALAV